MRGKGITTQTIQIKRVYLELDCISLTYMKRDALPHGRAFHKSDCVFTMSMESIEKMMTSSSELPNKLL